ncbi:unnamed protein product [Adineta steineri]|uniref:t-SNARE coiled-coil homology domain-containing protein n=2 Tax=Adineta steineri TaxID=433720 RepID=A0A820DL63_9BILA|nr:unnamed protein product [Adineta steineri]
MLNTRDRTDEFGKTVKQIISRRDAFNSSPNTSINCRQQPQSVIKQHVVFMQSVKKVGEDLSQILLKLEQLAIITKQSSLFNDKTMEIDDLSQSINQDITNSNLHIGLLQQYIENTAQFKSEDSKTHNTLVVSTLRSNITTMSNGFKAIRDAQIQNMKKQKTRRDNFSRSTVALSLTAPSSVTNSKTNQPSILFRDDNQSAHEDATIISMDSEQRFHSPLKQQMQKIDEADMEYRLQTMQRIEQTIVEVGDSLTQLATIIHEQKESIEKIDINVNQATNRVEDAHRELSGYYDSMKSSRWLIIKVFAVLIIFFLIFLIFFA